MTDRVRAVFLGSGGFAVPILDALASDPTVDVAGVVTTPPRPAGRAAVIRPTPVADRASALGLSALTPERLRDPGVVGRIGALRPDLLVLADYGRIVPAALLDLPRLGALNLHPSLLPRHRGATPIPAAIAAGDPETGVSLMRMDTGIDTGPLIAQVRVPLSGDEDAPGLEARLAEEAARLLRTALPGWLDGSRQARPQPDTGATLTRPFRREDGRLDAGRAAVDLERQVRALRPWPGTYLEHAAGRILVRGARVLDVPPPAGRAPGDLVLLGRSLALMTADGLLELVDVQPAGGRPMSGAELARGRPGILAGAAAVPGPAVPPAVPGVQG